MRLWQGFPWGFGGRGGDRKAYFQLIPVGTGGTNISVELYEHCKAQGIALDWGIALVSQEEDAKKLKEKGMDEDRIILLSSKGEGFGRDIEKGCWEFKGKREDIEKKVNNYLHNTIFIIISGEGGGTSGAFWESDTIKIFSSHARTEGIFCFIIVSHEDAAEIITANEKKGFDAILKISEEYDNVYPIMIVNPFIDYNECNSIIVEEITLPFLRCFRPDPIAEQDYKKNRLGNVILAVPATSKLSLDNVDREGIKNLVKNAATSKFIGMRKIEEVKGCFKYIISIFQAPKGKIMRWSNEIEKEIKEVFGIEKVEFFGAPEEGIRYATLLLLCIGVGDKDKYKKIRLMRRIDKSREIGQGQTNPINREEVVEGLREVIEEREHEGSREVSESGIERVRRRFG